ncbi:hypothetical protein BRPE64_BCDS06930 [Caballeronia insecticola]|uniref:Uncharacterized protein n=1 Tax=Caballeronia insecticola TaxID=758793 RepID=R4WLK0_9BURK|nr:hypothetical protein BRPE64_BCDS06930 [Caballeronia insecticola]
MSTHVCLREAVVMLCVQCRQSGLMPQRDKEDKVYLVLR